MKNQILKLSLLAITPLLMATQCEPDSPAPATIFNEFKVSITNDSNFILNDTIWVSGKVSSMAFDEEIGDSIFIEDRLRDYFSVLKLKEADNSGNSVDALDRFTLVASLGELEEREICPNSEVLVMGELSDDEQNYQYRLGFVPLEEGDSVLTWNFNSILTNFDRNLDIVEAYPIDGFDRALGLNKCSITSLLLDVETSNREFFFTVE